MSSEILKTNDALSSFADSCSTMLLALGTPILANIIAAANSRLGLPTLALGEGLALASYIAGRVIDVQGNDDKPKRPLPSENLKSLLIESRF